MILGSNPLSTVNLVDVIWGLVAKEIHLERRGGNLFRGFLVLFAAEWNREGWTFALGWGYCDVSSEGLGQIFANRESQPAAMLVQVSVLVDFSEHLEKLGEDILLNAHSTVSYVDVYDIVFSILSLQNDRAFLRVL